MNTTLVNLTLTASPITVMYSMIFFFSVNFPLNCYILFLLLSKGRALDVSTVFTLNNVLTEIFISIMSLGYGLALVYFNPLFFGLMNFIFGSTMSTRFLFQFCVCLERYLAVVHPVTFLRFKPVRYRAACSVLVWICAQGVAAISLFSFPVPPYNLVTIMFLILLTGQLYFGVSVLKCLLRPAPGDQDKRSLNTAKQNAFQVICINLTAIIIQNTPIAFFLCLESRVSIESLNIIKITGVMANIITGFFQPVYILHKAGKLWF